MFPVIGGTDVVAWEEEEEEEEGKQDKPQKKGSDRSEIEMMKERFAKLLLGEDMSGGGKGVCAALAISNAITNLSATVFGELRRLEPLSPQKKAMWRREMEWLLCVCDSIVDLVPSTQQGGGAYEIMETRPRSDLTVNLPALKKLDAMLLSMLDGFSDTEFWYADSCGVILADDDGFSDSNSLNSRHSVRQAEKWWIPCPMVPPSGLSEDARKGLQQCRDNTSQILKAAMAINSTVLSEVEIPNAYFDTLPKSGKACLGDFIYHHITAEEFSPELILDRLDLSSEHQTLEIANRVEAALHVWKQKDHRKQLNHIKDSLPSKWGGKVKGLVIVADSEKNHCLAQRAEMLLQSLRYRFPGLTQTTLEMHKIQYNKDIGQSILESYSRVLESLAFNIMARIHDVLYADDTNKQCAAADEPVSLSLPRPFSIHNTPSTSPGASPVFSSSAASSASPERTSSFEMKTDGKQLHDDKLQKPAAAGSKRLWSYAGNLSSRILTWEVLERD